MPKAGEIDYTVGQLMLSAIALRNEIEDKQHLERLCRDANERRRINGEWNQLEAKLDNLHQYILGNLREYRAVVDGWSLRTLGREPSFADLGSNSTAASTANASRG